MSRRKDKTEKGTRIAIGQKARQALQPLFMAINERMVGIRTALNVPDNWTLERDQQGTPIAFVPPPKLPERPTKVATKKKKRR